MATTKITLEMVKDPDGWGRAQQVLGLTEETTRAFFEHGEYAYVEVELDESLRVVSGRLVPRSEWR